ncbi:MAG: PfkB family carbohydrate kinase [Candidatus Bathyarchaeota archaeon]|nr:PfkB family carbohydrate kinase [Candidatus Bathyarchaeota archaeon]
MAPSSDIVVVGHFSVDTIVLPSLAEVFVGLGGSVAYSSFAARLLGSKVGAVSKVGSDFLQEYENRLKLSGIDLCAVTRAPESKTTQFELVYSKDLSQRSLTLKSQAPPLTIEDLPADLKAEIIHVAPIAREVTPEVVEQLRGCCKVLCVDPQGMLRHFDADGKVSNNQPVSRELLGLMDIYKSSLNEILATTGKSDLKQAIKAVHDFGVETVIVTFGAKGAILSTNQGAAYNLPTFPCRGYVDPTGAGDVFMGAFLSEHLRKKELLWCGCVGSAAASLVVESVGATGFGSKAEVYRRAGVLYEKEIKQ